MWFELLGPISGIETIAIGTGIREINRLHKRFGSGRWRKNKGFAKIRLADGTIVNAELHWYEAHGIGKKGFKVKRFREYKDE